MPGQLEHTNYSVSDPARTAQMLIDIFGWHIRWQGDARDGSGYTVHVGTDDAYVALYATPGQMQDRDHDPYVTVAGLNHIGVVVEDFEATETRVRAAGFTPGEHHDYEPGRRFYFFDHDGIEYEVVNYA